MRQPRSTGFSTSRAASSAPPSIPRAGPRSSTACPSHARVFPVGRLDLDSTGLIILTNDGELTARLLHPRYHVEKEYIVTVRGVGLASRRLGTPTGVDLEDGLTTSPADVEVVRVGCGAAPDAHDHLADRHTGGAQTPGAAHAGECRAHSGLALHRRRFDGLTDAGLALGRGPPSFRPRRSSGCAVSGQLGGG